MHQQSLSNLFLCLSPCALALWPQLFFIKPIAGVQAHCWMRRDFRYFYSCIFHNVLSCGPDPLHSVIEAQLDPGALFPPAGRMHQGSNNAQLFIWDYS